MSGDVGDHSLPFEGYLGGPALAEAPADAGRVPAGAEQVAAAVAVIARHAGVHPADIDPRSPASVGQAVRYAQRNTHPDTGGRAEDFAAVTHAQRVLERAGSS